MTKSRKFPGVKTFAFCFLLAAFSLFFPWNYCSLAVDYAENRVHGPRSIQERVTQYGAQVDQRLAPRFKAAGINYPPANVALIALKQERQFQLYAANADKKFHLITSYPILAASGHLGPKLRQGDNQVPEGIYRIDSLNPNSLFHLSLHVGYPNDFDRAQARKEGRTDLGGDIMIHGNAVSIGCIAIGDSGAEDVFILSARTGLKNIRVVLAPYDFRSIQTQTMPQSPSWLPQLYHQIQTALADYPLPAR